MDKKQGVLVPRLYYNQTFVILGDKKTGRIKNDPTCCGALLQ
jgi:hypothetical protein